ncbi:DUF1289 domain-containing protein [Shewanella surugensis]|uniref:DUF1289 domain-containing protein n=1 Tax=Shewanella surugensis TaxID=212020 RepID=A0ABT0LGQ5_9GAMM|nr:DUF1289 domain-containing protein [Shewanella surugensis]MCL1126854.1 DUF1289 domain-containing protein [Shewanella surugensis]
MQQLEFFEVPSPCIGVCQSDARGYCLGCFRSRNERFQWLDYSDHQKQWVIKLCKQRKRRRQLAAIKAKPTSEKPQKTQHNNEFDF